MPCATCSHKVGTNQKLHLALSRCPKNALLAPTDMHAGRQQQCATCGCSQASCTSVLLCRLMLCVERMQLKQCIVVSAACHARTREGWQLKFK